MKGYTNAETLSVIQNFIRELFKSNAIVDNISYALATDLEYPILSDNIHHKIAHSYGAQSDIITDYLDLRNDRVLRGKELVEPKKYTSVSECLSDIISVQEITFGENLMPKTLRYSVVDTDIKEIVKTSPLDVPVRAIVITNRVKTIK